jgi:hypothetical protein
MEGNVWMQWFAQVVATVSNLFTSLNNPQSRSNGGASQSAQKNAADSISTSTNATNQLRVTRDPSLTVGDSLFGDLDYNGTRICFTLERTEVAIPEGVYNAHLEMSPHFGFVTPHIDVPQRTYIECHPLNYASQSEGCVGVGSSIDGAAVDNSKQAFDSMMAVLPQEFLFVVTSK